MGEDKLREHKCSDQGIGQSKLFKEEVNKCSRCEYTRYTQQVARRDAGKHKLERDLQTYVPGNFCPICDKVFACSRTALQHDEKTSRKGIQANTTLDVLTREKTRQQSVLTKI